MHPLPQKFIMKLHYDRMKNKTLNHRFELLKVSEGDAAASLVLYGNGIRRIVFGHKTIIHLYNRKRPFFYHYQFHS